MNYYNQVAKIANYEGGVKATLINKEKIMKPSPPSVPTIVVKDKNNNMISCDHAEAQKKVNDGWTVTLNKSGKKLEKATKKKK